MLESRDALDAMFDATNNPECYAMNSTASDTVDKAARAAREAGSDFRRRGAHVKNVSSGELSAFLADVEDLIKQVSNISDADVARVRAKVANTLDDVRRSATETAAGLRDRALMAADATDDYVRDRPWTAIGVAAAVGLLLGISVAAAARR
jgi:ElaB/YqjD/DUF883 family membrane-anchored ribosome-binding protein